MEDEIVVDALVYLATRDPNKYVRHGALLYIQRVWTDDIVEDIEAALKDSSSKVRQAALKLFEQHGTTENLKCIEPLLDDDQVDVRKSARAATLAILSKCAPHEAISFFRQSPRDERRDFDDYLKTVVSKAYPAELRLLLNDSDEAVRHIAFREIVSKGELQEHELWQFTKDPYHRIRYDAYLGLLKRGIELDSEGVAKETELPDIFLLRRFGDERDRLLLEVYKTYSVDKLQSQIDWNSITGVLAYEALGLRHFEDFGEQIRQDLKTNFERIKQETIAKYRAQFGLTADIHLYISKYDSFIRENFTAAGLRVLAACGDKEDVTIAQTYITTSDSKIQEPAVEMVARHGNQDDSLILFDIAKNSYFDMKRIAATGALHLDKNNEMKIIEKFLQSKDAMLVGMALKHCLENAIQINLDEVKAMLYIDNTEIRTYALAYLTSILSETELEQLLAEYSSAGGYYYNVITWLDRWLYAPKKLRESFREELNARIFSA